MAIPHVPSYTKARYHYARLLLTPTPTSSASPSVSVDVPTLIQLLSATTTEWFGSVGGPVGLSEIDILLIEPVHGANEGDPRREAVLRFPAGATNDLLTTLPLTPSASFRLEVLSDSPDLARVGGFAGRGKAGYKAWLEGVKKQAEAVGGANGV